MAKGGIADQWLQANGHKRKWRDINKARKPNAAKETVGQAVRFRRIAEQEGSKAAVQWVAQNGRQTIREFVEEHRDHAGAECVFVPGSLNGVPASMRFLNRKITAARYMLLLKAGTPKNNAMVVRHLCGNGHLSCVNPNHLAWGARGDNVSDANKHRAAGDNVQDRVHSID